MELSKEERQKVVAVLMGYSSEWATAARRYPEMRFSPDAISQYLMGEAIVTLQHRNDVLGDD